MKDLTREYDYKRLIEEEKEHYSRIEVTDKLTEGGIHAYSSWEYYWMRVTNAMQADPEARADVMEYFREMLFQGKDKINILSLGSGYCGQEIMMAQAMEKDYEILCTDINECLFEKAKETVSEKGLNIRFQTCDLNFMTIPEKTYDLIYAHAVLHHVINLEHLFSEIGKGLTETGVFYLVEVTGENRRLLWRKNEEFVNSLLALMPFKPQVEKTISVVPESGMEGIRQEDILPLLKASFTPVFEYRHGAFMRFVCLNDEIGKKLDPKIPAMKSILDFLIDADESAVKHGLLEPLEIWGIYKPR